MARLAELEPPHGLTKLGKWAEDDVVELMASAAAGGAGAAPEPSIDWVLGPRLRRQWDDPRRLSYARAACRASVQQAFSDGAVAYGLREAGLSHGSGEQGGDDSGEASPLRLSAVPRPTPTSTSRGDGALLAVVLVIPRDRVAEPKSEAPVLAARIPPPDGGGGGLCSCLAACLGGGGAAPPAPTPATSAPSASPSGRGPRHSSRPSSRPSSARPASARPKPVRLQEEDGEVTSVEAGVEARLSAWNRRAAQRPREGALLDLGRHLEIHSLAVRPDMQGNGLGTRLVHAVTMIAETAGGLSVYAAAHGDAAFRFYGIFGFDFAGKFEVTCEEAADGGDGGDGGGGGGGGGDPDAAGPMDKGVVCLRPEFCTDSVNLGQFTSREEARKSKRGGANGNSAATTAARAAALMRQRVKSPSPKSPSPKSAAVEREPSPPRPKSPPRSPLHATKPKKGREHNKSPVRRRTLCTGRSPRRILAMRLRARGHFCAGQHLAVTDAPRLAQEEAEPEGRLFAP